MSRKKKSLTDVQTAKTISFPFVLVNTNRQRTIDLDYIAGFLNNISISGLQKVKLLRHYVPATPVWGSDVIEGGPGSAPEGVKLPDIEFGVFYTTAKPPTKEVIAELINEWNKQPNKRMWF